MRPEEQVSEARLPLSISSPRHLPFPHARAPGALEVVEEGVAAPGNDENAVSLEHELSKMSANQLRYDSAARIVQLQLGQLRYAANDGSGG